MSLFGTYKAGFDVSKGLEPIAFPEATLAMTVQQTRVYGSTTSGGAAFTITLPPVAKARGIAYMIYMVARNGVKDITIEDNEGDAGFSDIILDLADQYYVLMSDGQNWFHVAAFNFANDIVVTYPLTDFLDVGTIYVAAEAVRVISVQYTPHVVGSDGGAVTLTVVKAGATATPVKSTTPLHTADSIDLKGTVHTVQTETLSSTVADLILASGEKIGFDADGTLAAVDGTIQVRLRRL